MIAMPLLPLPHSIGCLVCGRNNPQSLRLSLQVDSDTGEIHTTFTPQPQHTGFVGVIHGGVLALVADEAMVWAAIWSTRRSCLAGELTLRFKRPATVGQLMAITARVTRKRSRVVEAECKIADKSGEVVAAAVGKYVPLGSDETTAFLRTLVAEPHTRSAIDQLSARL
jgi:uncharacterized protein (TIGR00369 family)